MKTILIDLDGVLNNYCSDYIKNFIPPLKKEAREFLQILSERFKVVIFSTRNKTLIKKWLENNNLTKYISSITNVKAPAFVQIDNRCINFNSNYADTIKKIENFLPFRTKSNLQEQV